VTLLDKLKTRSDREWYLAKAIEHGWSRNVMWHHISTALHLRSGNAVTNFEQRWAAGRIPNWRSKTLKDPYLFDFLGVSRRCAGTGTSRGAMVRHVTKLLMELGEGFCLRRPPGACRGGGRGFLHRSAVLQLPPAPLPGGGAQGRRLQAGTRRGNSIFYVTLVDERLKSADDQPTIGLLLCKQQHRIVAEYALRGMTQPIGMAEYKLQLPDDLARYLPSIEQIEAELQDEAASDDEDAPA
jgi:hypothetical protein